MHLLESTGGTPALVPRRRASERNGPRPGLERAAFDDAIPSWWTSVVKKYSTFPFYFFSFLFFYFYEMESLLGCPSSFDSSWSDAFRAVLNGTEAPLQVPFASVSPAPGRPQASTLNLPSGEMRNFAKEFFFPPPTGGSLSWLIDEIDRTVPTWCRLVKCPHWIGSNFPMGSSPRRPSLSLSVTDLHLPRISSAL